jgi:hypothetical protein
MGRPDKNLARGAPPGLPQAFEARSPRRIIAEHHEARMECFAGHCGVLCHHEPRLDTLV